MTGKGQKHSFANGPPRRARAQWRMAHPDNNFLANYQFLARYDRSMIGRLFDACEKLPTRSGDLTAAHSSAPSPRL